jgi:hypothetical protein
MHLLFFVGFSSILALAQPPATSPSQWPGWSNLRNCVQNAIVNYNMYYAGCGDWQCMCEHSSIAGPDILSAVINECSSDDGDISTATSIFNWFCSQFPYSTASLLPGVTVTDPSQWPGWSDLRGCVQNAIVNYNMYYAGCGDWQCMCEHGSIAEADILSAVINECSSNEPDIAVATSIFNGFCSQLPGVTDFQAVPASTASPVAGLTASPATATPTCNYSQLHVLI